MLELKNLIERGYFPKELPPPFNTSQLSQNIDSIIQTWTTTLEQHGNNKNKYGSSKAVDFSISKGKLSRRFLYIPNPKHFIDLSEKIVAHWQKFKTVFDLSEYSRSLPEPEINPIKRSVSTLSKSVSDFKDHKISASLSKLIEIRVDISKFYPTIYTHSIAWAFLGKEEAKSYYNKKNKDLKALIKAKDKNAELYKFADDIDISVRSCQDRQSIGIPIGPDTSHIISELIACRIDSILQDEFSNIKLKGCRYYDDYYLYVSTRDEADRVLKGLQRILNDFQLEINESKLRIKEFPFAFEDKFTLIFNQFHFKETSLSNSIKHYFSLVWGLIDENSQRSDWIFKYALKIFEFRTVTITKKSWKIFEDLLLKSALIEPAILDIVTRILLTYKSYLDNDSKTKLYELIELIIENHSPVRHNFEVAWALWLAKTFEIKIKKSLVDSVIQMKDSISLLILLDILKNTALIDDYPDYPTAFSDIEKDITEDSFFSQRWLLAYEGLKKGWISSSTPDLIDNNHFFKILKDLDIEFYDSTKQLEIYLSKDKNELELDVSPDYTASSNSVENTDLSTSDVGSLIPSNL
ncbi:RNA-directed DNA polymerase [Spirulina sp. 06S082]|uniref:RNA-directed DNA polymerase n=1 Tax=Spirulina sp. 06S082 TaxID=3110248 RepID=UPI002B1F018A|nr:RNA-directed DNA polymerase [Spirulina sp. 06S082]MEA5471542.1 RNA-directed DNA polymerase [Spirulina sp. 06S082]